ncbi:hypothetical protein ILYODFUR_032987 [Ilyodon furcidens]|uniref:Uncharacterized protein n=1 Tax=Ilyodon furcidens TaxID=33524 RepID=A0ABV0UAF6_9TELE
MDHLSTMKRKNVVLVYNLLLEMMDANTSSSSSSQTAASSPSSDTYCDGQQYHPPPFYLQADLDQTFTASSSTDNSMAPLEEPSEDQPMVRHLQSRGLLSSPLSIIGHQMKSEGTGSDCTNLSCGYIAPEQWSLDGRDASSSAEPLGYIIHD